MSSQIPAPRSVESGASEVIHHEGYDASIVSPFVPVIRTVATDPVTEITRPSKRSVVTGARRHHHVFCPDRCRQTSPEVNGADRPEAG